MRVRSSIVTMSQDSAFSAAASLTSASKLVMTTSGLGTCTCKPKPLSGPLQCADYVHLPLFLYTQADDVSCFRHKALSDAN